MILRRRSRSIHARLMLLFSLVLIAFTLIQTLLYSALLRRGQIAHFSQSIQRHAYAISQNLSEIVVPTAYDALDETRFIVSEDTLAPYMALIEQLTRCEVYLVSAKHDVLGYFDGVVQQIDNPLLPAYIEQTIALGFMGKTPFLQTRAGQDTHLTTCMPIMNPQSRVLGVVLLKTTLREQGYTQSPTVQTLLLSCFVSFLLSVLLAMVFSRQFTHPISALQKVALALAQGQYETRTQLKSDDEIGSLARSMDILAERLEESRRRDEQLRSQQQAFFASVSHELKTPVTVIRGSLEALSDGVVSDEQSIRAYYAQMIAESRWLQRLIQDLLELARLQNLEFSLDMADLDLSELLGDVAMSAHALCERKGVILDCQEPEGRFPFHGDYTRLRQMLLALVDNAVKFTPPGKRVCLRLTGPRPVIVIADEGEGIPEEDLPRIFERYHHARGASREGTGLGLSIVREIARRHDIRIDVRSRIGEGSVFTLTFPRAR